MMFFIYAVIGMQVSPARFNSHLRNNRDRSACSFLMTLQSSRNRGVDLMFKTRAAVFYRDLKPRGAAEWF